MATFTDKDFKFLELSNIEEIKEDIGQGAFTNVFKVRYHGSDCAAKSLTASVSTQFGLKLTKNNLLAKCRLWANLRHPKIVQFMGCFFKSSTTLPVLVMEKMDMNLTTLLHDNPTLPAATKLSILLDVAQGVSYLHCLKNYPIVHGSLTPSNILLTAQLQAKISDVGVSQFLITVMSSKTQLDKTVFSPPEYSSQTTSLDASVDIFSYGVVMIHVDTLALPEPVSADQPVQSYNFRKPKPIEYAYQPLIDKMTLNLQPLVISCLDCNPKKRPKIAVILRGIVKSFSDAPKTSHTLKEGHGYQVRYAQPTYNHNAHIDIYLDFAYFVYSIDIYIQIQVNVASTRASQFACN